MMLRDAARHPVELSSSNGSASALARAVRDEDEPCLEPSLFFPASGLAMFPKTGHVVNLEEPALFNDTLSDFLARVDSSRCLARDPRSLRAGAPEVPR